MNRKTDVGTGATALLDLRGRVRAATGPDREIDEGLSRIFGFDEFYFMLRHDTSADQKHLGETEGFWTILTDNGRGSSSNAGTLKRSASIDAALALVERVLPGWGYVLTHPVKNAYLPTARIFDAIFCGQDCSASANTMPLAILGALLSALIEQARSADSTPPLTTGGE